MIKKILITTFAILSIALNCQEKNIFNEKDSDYILSQFATSKDFLLSYKYITDLKIIHSDKLLAYKKLGKGFWSVFEEKHGNEGFMFVGRPLFSLNKKRVVISYGYYCGGLCGKGSRVILKKINDNWVFEKEISGFIS